jgi:predicted alpha/beta hydrolase
MVATSPATWSATWSASGASSITGQVTVIAAGDVRIAARTYEPAGPARGTVLLAGATAVPQRFYARFAAYLAGAGLRVVTYDYRGVGDSRPRSLRGYAATMTQWAELDTRAACAWVRATWPGSPLALVGHSFGGQLLGLIDDLHDVTGALFVAVQLPWVGHFSPLIRARMQLIWRVLVPALNATFGYLPGRAGLGEDLPSGVVREWGQWCLQRGYLLDSRPDAAARFARFRRPVALYSFTDDRIAPRPALAQLERVLSGADVVRRRFHPSELGVEEVGHVGFFRPHVKDTLWAEARDYLQAVLDGRPARLAHHTAGVDAVTDEELMRDLAYGRR